MTTKHRQPVSKQRLETATISKRRRAFLKGYRSGLEDDIATQIAEAGKPVLYERPEDKITYTVPERQATYSPDFKLPKQGGFFFCETKGIFDVADRAKHLLIKQQHPDIDIRFVFSNQNQKIYKNSPTSYAMWCEKHGFRYANKTIPTEWLTEGDNQHEPIPEGPEPSD